MQGFAHHSHLSEGEIQEYLDERGSIALGKRVTLCTNTCRQCLGLYTAMLNQLQVEIGVAELGELEMAAEPAY